MSERPPEFRVNYQHHLAKGLVFAGLGAHAGGTHYHDSSLYNQTSTFAANKSSGDWFFSQGTYCVNFDGTSGDGIYLPNSILPSSAFSLCAWTRMAVGALQNGRFFTQNGTGFIWYLNTIYGSAVDNMRIYAGSEVVVGGSDMRDAQWHHIGVTKNGSSWILYEDGKSVASASNAASPSAGSAGIAVNSIYWAGDARDVTIHHRALSLPEIQQLADPSNVMLSGLILPPARRWWPVSSGGGATVAVTLGTVAVTGNACSISAGTSISCTLGSLGVSPSAVTISAGTTVNATAGTVSVTGNNCSISAGTSVSATLGTVTVTGNNCSISAGTTVAATLGTVTLTGNAATISAGGTISCTLGTVAVTANNCSISAATTLSATAGTVTITSYAASVSAGTTVACSLGQIVAAALNATVTATTSSTINCTAGTVTLASYAATLSTGTTPDGVDFRAGDYRPHFSAADNRPHYRADDNRPHFTSG